MCYVGHAPSLVFLFLFLKHRWQSKWLQDEFTDVRVAIVPPGASYLCWSRSEHLMASLLWPLHSALITEMSLPSKAVCAGSGECLGLQIDLRVAEVSGPGPGVCWEVSGPVFQREVKTKSCSLALFLHWKHLVTWESAFRNGCFHPVSPPSSVSSFCSFIARFHTIHELPGY